LTWLLCTSIADFLEVTSTRICHRRPSRHLLMPRQKQTQQTWKPMLTTWGDKLRCHKVWWCTEEKYITEGTAKILRVNTIDCTCKDGRFPVPTSCVTISNPVHFPTVKQGLFQGKYTEN
jgi:hypothetical protein